MISILNVRKLYMTYRKLYMTYRNCMNRIYFIDLVSYLKTRQKFVTLRKHSKKAAYMYAARLSAIAYANVRKFLSGWLCVHAIFQGSQVLHKIILSQRSHMNCVVIFLYCTNGVKGLRKNQECESVDCLSIVLQFLQSDLLK